jgi:hypothetical protein
MEEKVQLRNLLNRYKVGDELEIRVGNFEERVDNRGYVRTNFRPFIGEFSYNYLLKTFFEPGSREKTRVEQIINTFNGGFRRIFNIVTREVQIIQKQRKGVVDLKDKGLRVALSSERIITNWMPRKETSLSEKRRTRSSFKNDEGTMRYDITKDEYLGGGIDYQFEIEYITQPDLESLEDMVKIIEELRKVMWKHHRLIGEFNRFFADQFKGKFSETPYTPGKKPRDLKIYDIPYLENYVIYPKFDGVAFFLMCVGDGVYYINRTDIIAVYDEIPELNGTVIMGELVKNPQSYRNIQEIIESGKSTFFALDMPWYKGQDLRNHTFLERLAYLEDVITFLDDEEMKLVPNFFGKRGISTAYNFINQTKFKQDGLVFIPNDLPYTNNFNYKWKPPDKLTIDFRVSQNRDGSFTLYSYGKNNKSVVFRGTRKYPFPGTTRVSERDIRNVTKGGKVLPTNKIIEFSFSKRRFIPVRIRKDKIKPNFIGVAQNIWEIIQNPLTSENLVRGSAWTIINKGEPQTVTAEKICRFLTSLTRPEPKVFDRLDTYLGFDTITKAFYDATIKGVNTKTGNYLVGVLQNYFAIPRP